jgi:N-acetylmuramoyl-L-alanine amidase
MQPGMMHDRENRIVMACLGRYRRWNRCKTHAVTANRFYLLFRCSLVLLISGITGTVVRAADPSWDVVKIADREYVSVESIKNQYGFTKLTRNGNNITLENQKVLIKMRIGSHECLMNNVKFVFTDKVEVQGAKVLVSRMDLAKLIDPVLRPSYIPNAGNFRTVILDAGHGGKDPGATNSLGTEAAYNLKLVRLLKAALEARQYRVVMTRDADRYLSLQERVKLANSVMEPAIFISIHFNSGGKNARGIETFTLSPPGVSHYGRGLKADDFQQRAGNEHDSANIALATAVHGTLLSTLKDPATKKSYTFDRGIKRARFSVLSGVRHPAILFEGGFMSHSYDAQLINNDTYHRALASGIVAAIERYRVAVSMPPATTRY